MKLLFIAFLLPLQVLSQDITGIWTGQIETNGNAVPYELVISADLTGYSLTTFTIDGIENTGVKSIKLKQKSNSFFITDGDLVYSSYPSPARRVKLLGSLSLQVEDTIMTLSGSFQTKSLDFRAQDRNAYSGTITLRRQNKLARTKLISKLDELHLLNNLSFFQPKTDDQKKTEVVAAPEKEAPSSKIKALPVGDNHQGKGIVAPDISAGAKTLELAVPIKAAADLAARKTEVIRTILFASDSLVLTLYDNGIVDGDTVSVVLNDKVIIPRQGLSEKAFRLVVQVTPDIGDSLQLIMYAENLGTIPPNTGLLIVEDGGNRHEIRFEGDLQKSSAVILRRKR